MNSFFDMCEASLTKRHEEIKEWSEQGLPGEFEGLLMRKMECAAKPVEVWNNPDPEGTGVRFELRWQGTQGRKSAKVDVKLNLKGSFSTARPRERLNNPYATYFVVKFPDNRTKHLSIWEFKNEDAIRDHDSLTEFLKNLLQRALDKHAHEIISYSYTKE
jgi:hypothetical protein